MPMLVFTCSKCNLEFEKLSKDEFDGMKRIMWEDCPNQSTKGMANKSACPIERQVTTSNFGDPVRMGRIKPEPQFREQVERIKRANPGHRIQ